MFFFFFDHFDLRLCFYFYFQEGSEFMAAWILIGEAKRPVLDKFSSLPIKAMLSSSQYQHGWHPLWGFWSALLLPNNSFSACSCLETYFICQPFQNSLPRALCLLFTPAGHNPRKMVGHLPRMSNAEDPSSRGDEIVFK